MGNVVEFGLSRNVRDAALMSSVKQSLVRIHSRMKAFAIFARKKSVSLVNVEIKYAFIWVQL